MAMRSWPTSCRRPWAGAPRRCFARSRSISKSWLRCWKAIRSAVVVASTHGRACAGLTRLLRPTPRRRRPAPPSPARPELPRRHPARLPAPPHHLQREHRLGTPPNQPHHPRRLTSYNPGMSTALLVLPAPRLGGQAFRPLVLLGHPFPAATDHRRSKDPQTPRSRTAVLLRGRRGTPDRNLLPRLPHPGDQGLRPRLPQPRATPT